MIRKITLLTIAAVSIGAAAKEAKTTELTPMEAAAKVFNAVQTTDRLYKFLKIGAVDGDAAYLESLRLTTADNKLPLARGKGDLFYLQGLDKPIKAEDLKKGIFSYDGRKFMLDFSKGYRANMETIEKIMKPGDYAWMNWLLPQAHAAIDFTSLISGAMVGGGLGMMFSSNDSGMRTAGGLLALGGVFGMVLANNNNNKRPPPPYYPYQVSCPVNAYGAPQAQVANAAGSPLVYVSQPAPASPYMINSPYYSYPQSPYTQYSASQLYGYCGSPTMMSSVNTALAPTLPSAYPAPTTFYRGYSLPTTRQPASVQQTAPNPIVIPSASSAAR